MRASCATRRCISSSSPTPPPTSWSISCPAPIFPTGGIIVEPRAEIVQAYKTGRGSFRLRARWTQEDTGRGTYQIVVTEIPVSDPEGAARRPHRRAAAAEEAAAARRRARRVRPRTVRLVLEPKSRSVDPVLLMESLFKLTELETRVPLNMNVLSRGQVPNVLGLRQVLREWLDHRQVVLVRRSKFRLAKIDHRLEVLDGYLIVYLNIDKVIKIIREKDEPKPALDEGVQAHRRAGRGDPQYAAALLAQARGDGDQARARQPDQGAERAEGAARLQGQAVEDRSPTRSRR